MANRSWLWETNGKFTLYVQPSGVETEQVVFRWTNEETPRVSLRSNGQILTDCELVFVDNKSCKVRLSDEVISFNWTCPSLDREGLIAEGVEELEPTTWSSRR